MWKKLAALVTLAAFLASPSVFAGTGRFWDGTCRPKADDNATELDRFFASLQAANALLPKTPPPALSLCDDHAALAATLVPIFEGPRLFNEPSAIDLTTRLAFDPAPMVTAFSQPPATPVVIDRTIASNARRTDPLFLGGHFFYGAGRHIKAITIDATLARWHQISDDPAAAAKDLLLCSPVGGPVALLCSQVRQTVDLARAGHAAPLAIAVGYQTFLAEDNGDKAGDIGARAVDVVMLLGSESEGSGIAAIDEAIAKISLDELANGASSRLSRLIEDETGAVGKIRPPGTFENALEPFTKEGALDPDVLRESKIFIPGEELNNPKVIEVLTQDGSRIEDWGKAKTRSFDSPNGKFQIHFYKNKVTGEANYSMDFKMKFNAPPNEQVFLAAPHVEVP